MDSELLLSLIRSRLDGAVSEAEFERIRRGLAVADQGEGDEPDWDEIAELLLASLDEIENRMAYLEDQLEAAGLLPPLPSTDLPPIPATGEPALDLPGGSVAVVR